MNERLTPYPSNENEIPKGWRDVMEGKEKTTAEKLREAQDECFNASQEVSSVSYKGLVSLAEDLDGNNNEQADVLLSSANNIRNYYHDLTEDYVNLILHATSGEKVVNGLPSFSNLNDPSLTKERRLKKVEELDGTLQNSINKIITTIDPESYSDETIKQVLNNAATGKELSSLLYDYATDPTNEESRKAFEEFCKNTREAEGNSFKKLSELLGEKGYDANLVLFTKDLAGALPIRKESFYNSLLHYTQVAHKLKSEIGGTEAIHEVRNETNSTPSEDSEFSKEGFV